MSYYDSKMPMVLLGKFPAVVDDRSTDDIHCHFLQHRRLTKSEPPKKY